MKEFVFIKNKNLVPLPDQIEIWETTKDVEVLISNDKKQKSIIYAPEINFYLRNSQDDTLEKAKNILKLYQIRNHIYDLGLDFEENKQIQKRIILVDLEEELADFLKKNNFKVITLKNQEIKGIFGTIGELCAIISDEVEIDFDILIFNHKYSRKDFLRQSGCYNMQNFKDKEALLEFLNSIVPNYTYKNYFSYDLNICQYHSRRSEHCAKCVEICPTTAILKDDENKNLVFSQIDCLECGSCISICPSGSLDSANLPRNSFFKICNFFKKNKIVLISEKISLENLNLALPKNILPLIIKDGWFTPMHFLSLLQSSGANIIFFTKTLSEGNHETIELLNTFFERKFNKKAIFVANNNEEFITQLKQQEFIENLYFEFHNNTLTTRENFSIRMQKLIQNDDFGSLKSGNWIRYGKIEINTQTCTLCLSCVGACNVGALIADHQENALKFNASLCTTCGYCEVSCAEKNTLKLTRSGIEFNPGFFKYQTMAKDELFACIECGKEFATKKAIQKIAEFMKPKFKEDQNKIKTLYCCAECKAKIMIKSMSNL